MITGLIAQLRRARRAVFVLGVLAGAGLVLLAVAMCRSG